MISESYPTPRFLHNLTILQATCSRETAQHGNVTNATMAWLQMPHYVSKKTHPISYLGELLRKVTKIDDGLSIS